MILDVRPGTVLAHQPSERSAYMKLFQERNLKMAGIYAPFMMLAIPVAAVYFAVILSLSQEVPWSRYVGVIYNETPWMIAGLIPGAILWVWGVIMHFLYDGGGGERDLGGTFLFWYLFLYPIGGIVGGILLIAGGFIIVATCQTIWLFF